MEHNHPGIGAYEALKPRHRRFVDAYVGSDSATAAYVSVYGPSKSASSSAALLLRREDVRLAVSYKLSILSREADLDAIAYLRRLHQYAIEAEPTNNAEGYDADGVLRLKSQTIAVFVKMYGDVLSQAGLLRPEDEGEGGVKAVRLLPSSLTEEEFTSEVKVLQARGTLPGVGDEPIERPEPPVAEVADAVFVLPGKE